MHLERELDAILRSCVSLLCFEDCLELALDSLSRFGPLGSAFDHAAMVYEQLGDKESAYRFFSKSLELNPSHQWARQGMEKNRVELEPESKPLQARDIAKKVSALASWFGGWKR